MTAKRVLRAASLAAYLAVTTAARANEDRPWEIAPYHVQVTLAVDDALRPQPVLEAEVARTIRQRVDSALRPLWVLDVQIAGNAADRRNCVDPAEIPWQALTPAQRRFDKLLWLGVQATPVGYAVTSREFDVYTRRWGSRLERTIPQSSYLNEACFRMLTDAFTPLARVEAPNEDAVAQLVMKGGGLTRPQGPQLLTAPGDVFLPIMRRTGRGGELAEGGVVPLPWTYLVAAQPNRIGWSATVKTALRNPLSSRRRGSVEQLAVALKHPPEPIRIRFYARSNRDYSLAGYEVFRIADEDAEPELVGVTDGDGVIAVPPGNMPVTALVLRSEGQVLAKLLVAPGTAPIIEAPIADDAVRLMAQGEMQAVREELIDVVARRAILVARVQAALKVGDLDRARNLMDNLNDLPTPSAFASQIEGVQQRLPVSDDPRVRQSVEGLVASTRELLARFLDARTIIKLQAEVNSASTTGS